MQFQLLHIEDKVRAELISTAEDSKEVEVSKRQSSRKFHETVLITHEGISTKMDKDRPYIRTVS